MRNGLPRVLILEDDTDLLEIYGISLSDQFELIKAETVEEGKNLFRLHQHDLFAIVLDGNVNGQTSILLAQEILQTYLGHVLANSDHDGVQQQLVQTGCLGCLPHAHKWNLPEKLKQLCQE